MEAYREALLAGYPPESISAHQIPEGEAVAGFLGEANTRLTPVDVVLTCGTAYGGTRYGNLSRKTNFLLNAHNMGHSNITLGEYGSLYENAKSAYSQLKNLWKNGLRMVHHITFNDAQANAEKEAIRMMMEDNEPRPGYTGGTSGSVNVLQDGKSYHIVARLSAYVFYNYIVAAIAQIDAVLIPAVTADVKFYISYNAVGAEAEAHTPIALI
jgi:hypothetical protein